MIQFNLLPDVKLQYIKTQRLKRLVFGVSFVTGVAALFIFLVLLSFVDVLQKKDISDLNSNIQSTTSKLKNTPNIVGILTLQSQLNSLSSLNSQRPAGSRLFGYLSQLTPNQTTISDLQVDYTQDTMTITGNAPSLDAVNTFVDIIKYTTYSLSGQSNSSQAFSQVVLSSFGRSTTSATYTITLHFDQAIFNNANSVSLTVGNQSQTPPQPSIIFSKGP